jgi:hypothetical protein
MAEAMTARWALLKTIQEEAGNRLACYAMADLLEEQGWPDLGFCYRWMGWYDRRPGKREGKRLRKRFAWYREGARFGYLDQEVLRYANLPEARLPELVYLALQVNKPEYVLYRTWEQAVSDLAKGLARMRTLLEQPRG